MHVQCKASVDGHNALRAVHIPFLGSSRTPSIMDSTDHDASEAVKASKACSVTCSSWERVKLWLHTGGNIRECTQDCARGTPRADHLCANVHRTFSESIPYHKKKRRRRCLEPSLGRRVGPPRGLK